MKIVDSDAHVLEWDHTWDFVDESEARYRPVRVVQTYPAAHREFLVVDGAARPVRVPSLSREEERTQLPFGKYVEDVVAPDESRFMIDVQSRVRHMDELGTDVQVLYPTFFILPFTDRPEVELALSKSYNRWLAEIWSEGAGRLRWAAVLPLRTMEAALSEMHFAKEHGACAVFVRGIECGDKLLDDPYFFTVYEEASRLNLPVCVHTGNSSPALDDLYATESGFARFKLVGVGAFHTIVYSGIPDRFPDLRFGFIELSAQWIPYVIRDLERRFERLGKPMKSNILRDNRIYVTCQTNDDLPQIIDLVGDDNLVIGTDYGHADTSTELLALQTFQNQPGLNRETRCKILDDNARALYGL